jgi:hypothetical protein
MGSSNIQQLRGLPNISFMKRSLNLSESLPFPLLIVVYTFHLFSEFKVISCGVL